MCTVVMKIKKSWTLRSLGFEQRDTQDSSERLELKRHQSFPEFKWIFVPKPNRTPHIFSKTQPCFPNIHCRSFVDKVKHSKLDLVRQVMVAEKKGTQCVNG